MLSSYLHDCDAFLLRKASAIVGIRKAESPSLRNASTDWEGRQSRGCDRSKGKVPALADWEEYSPPG